MHHTACTVPPVLKLYFCFVRDFFYLLFGAAGALGVAILTVNAKFLSAILLYSTFAISIPTLSSANALTSFPLVIFVFSSVAKVMTFSSFFPFTVTIFLTSNVLATASIFAMAPLHL